MALSEIEKLERRYAENPQGLTFAPLAEVHRKNGDAARALELLRPGLALHPNYIPASIVLGRCHLDLGDLPAAETAFAHVISLDGENVIALKALADLSERQHHFDQAEQWLHTLLAVDRSNDEARAQLERIATARRDAAAVPSPPEIAAEAPTPEIPADPEPTEAVVETMPLALADLEPAFEANGPSEPPPPGLEVEEPELVEPEVEPIAGLIRGDVDDANEPTTEGSVFRVETSEDIVLRSSGGNEFQVPDAAQELSTVPVAPSSPFGEEPASGFGSFDVPPPAPPPREPAPEPEPVAERELEPELEPVPPAPEEEPVTAFLAPPEPEPMADVAATEPEPPPRPAEAVADLVIPPEPELVVTETMAEVLLRQGHAAEALRVYRELEARGAGDSRLRQKIAELEEAGRPAAPEPSAEPIVARRQYTAAETGGQSVGDFFQALLAARPPAAAQSSARAPSPPPPERSGAPTRPAADALSLSSVFGEESSPLPPAVPATPAAAAGVSFDEFYSPPGGGAGGGSASPKTRAPDPKSDDLDQFHAWLQNLKR